MASDETISIMEEEIPAWRELVDIDRLEFFPDNPRVYAAISEMGDFDALTKAEQQDRIYKQMLKEQSVKNLRPQIRRDGGLQEAIIVRSDTMQVIEGNSRLAAYRSLRSDSESDQWTHIKCLLVMGLTPDQQMRLLGQAHLHGRTKWTKYAKAIFCFRGMEERDGNVAAVSKLSGFSPATIRKNVKVIQLMRENVDDKQSRFSHYEVVVGTRAISTEVDRNPALKRVLLAQIKSDAFTALELRKRLPAVIKKPRILRKYEKGGVTLEDAYDRAKISGTEQRLKKIQDGLDDIDRGEIEALERQDIGGVRQAIRKIRQRLKRVSDMVEEQDKKKKRSSETRT